MAFFSIALHIVIGLLATAKNEEKLIAIAFMSDNYIKNISKKSDNSIKANREKSKNG